MYNIEKDIQKMQAELEIDKVNLEQVNAAQGQLEDEMKEKRKYQSVFTKEALLYEKKITKQKAELDKKVSIYRESWVLR
jgi:Skp family chaperone for outer membrane proteins